MKDLFGNTLIQKTDNLGVPYMGSKRKHADKLITKILEIKPDAKYFYDLFGGGGAMSFAALQRGLTVVYNEKQTDLVDLIKYIFECAKTPQSKFGIFPEEFYSFVPRDKFMQLRDEAGVYAQFVRICFSFGNNQRAYMFNRELEVAKHLAHDVVVYQCKKSLRELNKAMGFDFEISNAPTIYQRRLDLYKITRRNKKRLDLQQLEQLERLERLERLEQLQQLEQLQRLQQLERLQRLEQKITFQNKSYEDVKITHPIYETVVYLDPPYRGTAKYIVGLDHNQLDEWFKNLPYLAFMSEYSAPFECVHEIKTRSTLSSTNNSCAKIERLYVNK